MRVNSSDAPGAQHCAISRALPCALVLALLFVIAGCHTEGYITDQSNIETYVKNLSLCGDRYLTVMNGGAVRTVPLLA